MRRRLHQAYRQLYICQENLLQAPHVKNRSETNLSLLREECNHRSGMKIDSKLFVWLFSPTFTGSPALPTLAGNGHMLGNASYSNCILWACENSRLTERLHDFFLPIFRYEYRSNLLCTFERSVRVNQRCRLFRLPSYPPFARSCSGHALALSLWQIRAAEATPKHMLIGNRRRGPTHNCSRRFELVLCAVLPVGTIAWHKGLAPKKTLGNT